MLRPLNILFLLFFGLTVFLVIIHIQRVDYYEYPSKGIIENIYKGKTGITVHLSKYENDNYVLNLSFNHIKSETLVNDILVKVDKVSDNTNISLNLINIRPYSGMHPWDIPEYKSFSEIPTDLRELNTESNPYFAYDFQFEQNPKIDDNKFLVKINLNISEDGHERKLTRELTIQKISKIEVRPLDAHSDISFLLIPVTGILTIILAVIWILKRAKKKTNA